MMTQDLDSANLIQTNHVDHIDVPNLALLEQVVMDNRHKRRMKKSLLTTIGSLMVVASIAILVATLLLPVLRVTGTSMTPTLSNNDLVVCSKTGNYSYGDVVAFYYNNKILLKRVIGMPGDWIDIDDNGVVYVNGEAIEEDYVSELAVGECDITLPYQVPDNRIFVMGDHRSTSVDSRSTSVGCVSDENVIGAVICRVWPLDKLGTVN